MVAHQHERVHAPPRAPASLPERLQEALSVRVIPEDGLPPIATVEHVVNRAAKFDSWKDVTLSTDFANDTAPGNSWA